VTGRENVWPWQALADVVSMATAPARSSTVLWLAGNVNWAAVKLAGALNVTPVG
jgi:hypothetical protein